MAQSVNASGWVVEGDNVVLCPVVGFKVKPLAGGGCALQFNYYADRQAAEKNEVRAVQLAMSLEGVQQLLQVIQQVEAQMRSEAGGGAN